MLGQLCVQNLSNLCIEHVQQNQIETVVSTKWFIYITNVYNERQDVTIYKNSILTQIHTFEPHLTAATIYVYECIYIYTSV